MTTSLHFERLSGSAAELFGRLCQPMAAGKDVALPSAARLTVMRRLADLAVRAREIDDLPPGLQASLDEFAAAIEPNLGHSADPKVLHGILTSHPEFSALWYTPAQPNRSIELVQMSLISALVARPEISSDLDFGSARKEAGLACRSLFGPGSENLLRCVERAAQSARTFTDFAARLADSREQYLSENSLDAGIPRRLAALTCLIRYFTSDKRPSKREAATGRIPTLNAEGDLVDEPDVGGSAIEAPESPSTEKLRQSYAAAPNSERPRPHFVAVSVPDSLIQNNSARSLYRIAINQARARTSAAQKLPAAGDRLQLHDLQAWMTWTFSSAEDQQGVLLREFSTVSWLLSGSTDRVIGIKIAATLSDALTPGVPAYLVLDPLCWKIFTTPLKHAFRPGVEVENLYEPVDSWFLLPLPSGWPVIDRMLARARETIGSSLFRGTLSLWDAALRRELDAINKRFRCRLSRFRIASFLSRFVADLNGDRADGALLSLSEDPSGCAARLYYYAPEKQKLAATYGRALNEVFAALPDGRKIRVDPAMATMEQRGRVGSAVVAKHEAVRQCVGALVSTIPAVRRGRPTEAGLIEFHNCFAIYCTTALLWMVGIRAIRDPIELELTDLESGFLTISDKDGDEYSDARIAWIPPLGVEQLQEYGRHRCALLRRTEFRELQPDHWLFVIETGKARPITPKVLTRFWEGSFPFEPNAQRHYLRTRLREAKVAGEHVDAFLGHGAFGEEAYSRYSCLSPRDLRSVLREPLTTLIHSAGWKLIRGLS